jgi:hypothetical protein
MSDSTSAIARGNRLGPNYKTTFEGCKKTWEMLDGGLSNQVLTLRDQARMRIRLFQFSVSRHGLPS